jgi:hypothetical protein
MKVVLIFSKMEKSITNTPSRMSAFIINHSASQNRRLVGSFAASRSDGMVRLHTIVSSRGGLKILAEHRNVACRKRRLAEKHLLLYRDLRRPELSEPGPRALLPNRRPSLKMKRFFF